MAIYGSWDQIEQQQVHSSCITHVGQLVRIKLNCFEQSGDYGIIIECMTPSFGVGYDDDYLVLIYGNLVKVKNFMIHPVY